MVSHDKVKSIIYMDQSKKPDTNISTGREIKLLRHNIKVLIVAVVIGRKETIEALKSEGFVTFNMV